MEFNPNSCNQAETSNYTTQEVGESDTEKSLELNSSSEISDVEDDTIESASLSPPPDETTQYITPGGYDKSNYEFLHTTVDDKSNDCSNSHPAVEEKTNDDCFLLPTLTASEFPNSSRSQFHPEESTNCTPKIEQNIETSDSRQLIDPQLGAIVRKSLTVTADEHTTCTYLLLQPPPNFEHLNPDHTSGSGASQLLPFTSTTPTGVPLQPLLSELSLSSLAPIPRVILLPVPLHSVVPPASASSTAPLSDVRSFASTICASGAESHPHLHSLSHTHPHPLQDHMHDGDTWRTPSRPLHRCASTLSTASLHSSRPPSERGSDEDEDEEKRTRRPNRRLQQCPHCSFSTDRGFVLKRHIAAKHSGMIFSILHVCIVNGRRWKSLPLGVKNPFCFKSLIVLVEVNNCYVNS